MRERLLFVFALTAVPALAQQTSITGRLTDPSNAVMTNVIVTASADDGTKFATHTNGQGMYQLPAVRAGKYVLRFETPGIRSGRTHADRAGGAGCHRRRGAATGLGEHHRCRGSGRRGRGYHHLHCRGRRQSHRSQQCPAQRPQLSPAGDDGARHHQQRRHQFAAGRHRRRQAPDQRRRPAGDAELGGRHLRRAAIQPGRHRPVPDHHQPVRRHAGQVFARSGERADQVGHQPVITARCTDISATASSTPPIRWRTRCCPSPISSSAEPSAGRFSRTNCSSSSPMKESASRTRSSTCPPDSAASPSPSTTNCAPTATFCTRTGRSTAKQPAFGARDRLHLGRAFQQRDRQLLLPRAPRIPRAPVMPCWELGPGRITPRVVNEAESGLNHFDWQNIRSSKARNTACRPSPWASPYNYPQQLGQNTQQYRDDLFWLKGGHSFKGGVDYLHTPYSGNFGQNVRGTVLAFSSGVSALNLATIFPHLERSFHLESSRRSAPMRPASRRASATISTAFRPTPSAPGSRTTGKSARS